MTGPSYQQLMDVMRSRGWGAAEIGALRQRARRAAREQAGTMWWPIVAAGIVLAITVIIIMLLYLVPIRAPHVLPGLIVGIGGVIASIQTHDLVLRRCIAPYMRQLLEQGERTICRACGYNLIGTEQADEWCPECGSYNSRRLVDRAGHAPPVIMRSSERPHRLTLISGVELDPALLEHVTGEHAMPVARTMQAINLLVFMGGVILTVVCFVVSSPFGVTLMSLGTLAPVVAVAVWMIWQRRLRDRIIVRRVRRGLNRRGVPVCERCGRYRDPERVRNADQCPACDAPPPVC